MLFILAYVIYSFIQWMRNNRISCTVNVCGLPFILFWFDIDYITKIIRLSMAKSKSKSVNEEEVKVVQDRQTFIPLKNKYKPIPKFNGKCPNC